MTRQRLRLSITLSGSAGGYDEDCIAVGDTRDDGRRRVGLRFKRMETVPVEEIPFVLTHRGELGIQTDGSEFL